LNIDFKVSLESPKVDGSCVVVVAGEVDLLGAPQLKEILLRAIASGAKRVVVDMTDARFIDSTTLGVILGASKRLRTVGGELVLVIDHPSIRKIFEITLLDRAFRIFETREEALARLKREGLAVEELEEESASAELFPRRVRQADIIYTTSQLAVMVDTGITLSTALDSISQQEANPAQRRMNFTDPRFIEELVIDGLATQKWTIVRQQILCEPVF
jgi:anti-anti-sigma factor